MPTFTPWLTSSYAVATAVVGGVALAAIVAIHLGVWWADRKIVVRTQRLLRAAPSLDGKPAENTGPRVGADTMGGN